MTDSPFSSLLHEYVSSDEHIAHAQFAELVSQFHYKRAASIRARNAGNVPRAQLWESEAARLARDIEQILDLGGLAPEPVFVPSQRSFESVVFAQREREVTHRGPEQADQEDW